jgi:hypothetical protein
MRASINLVHNLLGRPAMMLSRGFYDPTFTVPHGWGPRRVRW